MIDLDEFAFCLFSLGGSVYPCMCVFLRVSLTGFPHSYVISIDGWCAGKFCLKLFCTMASFVGELNVYVNFKIGKLYFFIVNMYLNIQNTF